MTLPPRHPMRSPSLLQTKWLAQDALAGVVVFLIAAPASLGIAQMVGAPPASGILASIIGGILVGLLSGSQTNISGPSPGLVGILIAQLAVLPSFEAFLVAVVIAGLFQIALGAARIGFLAAFIPQDVIRGLLAALGIILILKHLPNLVGQGGGASEVSFWQPERQTPLSELFAINGGFQFGAALVGGLCIAVLLLWNPYRPQRLRFVPASLVAVLLGIVLHLGLRQLGSPWALAPENLLSVPVLFGPGAIDPLLHFPDFSWLTSRSVYASGAIIALVASLETMLNLHAIDHIDPRRRRSPVNRELIAQGVGNATCGLLGGLPLTALIIHSSVNINAQGQTKRVTIFHGLFCLLFVVLFPALLGLIPIQALAAILLVSGFKLAHPARFRPMWEGGRSQFIPFVVTLVAIVLTDLLYGVLIGLGVSIATILRDNMKRPLRRIVEKHLNEEVMHIELATQVSFLSLGVIDKTLSELPNGSQVLIDATDTEYIDPDVLTMIREFRDSTGPQRDIKVSLRGFSAVHHLEDEIQFVDYSSRELQNEITPAQVLQILREGNERFRTGRRLPRDLNAQIHGSSIGQFPLAVVLSCIDSRNPAEIIFDLGLGDIFSVRVAGNVIDPTLLGSMEYSTAVAGAKLILVMGHTSCGAVNAAVRLAHATQDYEQATGCQHLNPIVDQIKQSISRQRWEAIRTAPDEEVKRFADEIAKLNVIRVLQDILRESRTIKRLVDEQRIALIGAIYDVNSAKIEFLSETAIGLETLDLDDQPDAADADPQRV